MKTTIFKFKFHWRWLMCNHNEEVAIDALKRNIESDKTLWCATLWGMENKEQQLCKIRRLGSCLSLSLSLSLSLFLSPVESVLVEGKEKSHGVSTFDVSLYAWSRLFWRRRCGPDGRVLKKQTNKKQAKSCTQPDLFDCKMWSYTHPSYAWHTSVPTFLLLPHPTSSLLTAKRKSREKMDITTKLGNAGLYCELTGK